MPAPLLSKDEVLRRLMLTFRTVGYDAATLSLLAKETGLKKASLYHYFPDGKKGMAEAVLTHVGEQIDCAVFKPLQEEGPPRRRLEKMLEMVADFYETGQRWCLIELFSLGEAGELFGDVLSGVVDKWVGRLADIAQESGVSKERAYRQAEDALVSIQGSLVLSRAQKRPALFRRVLWEIPDKLLA